MKFETKVIHAGVNPDPSTGAIMTPIFQTSTYVQSSPGQHQGYEYARSQNPTRTALQNNLAALENGLFGLAFASGMAAMDAILRTLRPGDHIISTNDLYGGSYRLMTRIYKEYGINTSFVDMTDPSSLKEVITESTKLIWIETPTNPLLQIFDVKAICEIADEFGIQTCVDNTFATPYLQKPLDMGASMVLHSATKYIGGHSDLVLGAVVTRDQEIAENLEFVQNSAGAVPGPQDCFLALRGIKTLAIRVERSCENAEKIADFLNDHPKVGKVFYPGLKEHPGHELAKSQMKNFGAMISFSIVNDDVDVAKRILENTRYFSLAESLGGVESLIGHPASMTHASIPRNERVAVGLLDSTIRLSVGIENVEDLIEDLKTAMEK